MLFWNTVLYVAGALLALRSLISLMAQHKQHYEGKLRRQLAREARGSEAQNAAAEPQRPEISKAKPSAA